jgi:VanZ family protein
MEITSVDAMPALGRYAPPLALMAVILALSAQPDLSTGLGTWDLVARKIVHAAEYGLLWFLLWRAFGFRAPVLAAGIAIVSAASDEYRQTFVEGRHGTPVDVLIDSAGMALAWWLARRRRPAF